jgi:hypothetical protein
LGVVARAVSAWLARPAADGALPVVHAAVGASVESGELWGPGKRVGAPPRKETWRTLDDRDGAAQLWARSESLAQVRFLAA